MNSRNSEAAHAQTDASSYNPARWVRDKAIASELRRNRGTNRMTPFPPPLPGPTDARRGAGIQGGRNARPSVFQRAQAAVWGAYVGWWS